MDISKLSEEQFAVLFQAIRTRIKEDPIENFVKAAGFMDVAPSAAQEVILKIVFQKPLDSETKKPVQVEARDTNGDFDIIPSEMTEVEIYEYLTEKPYDPKKLAEIRVNKIDLICGRRSGKNLIAAIISLFFGTTVDWTPYLSKTPRATVLLLSHTKEFAAEFLDVLRDLIQNSPVLTRLVDNEGRQTINAMNLKVPFITDGKLTYSKVQIKVGAASSKTTRGLACCVVLFDECAFWGLEEGMKEADIKILRATKPALAQFGADGLLIKFSSPALKQGILYDDYQKSRKGELPDSYCVFKGPTWLLNDFIPKAELIESWRFDSESFRVEFGSDFLDAVHSFISPEFVDSAILKGVKFLAPSAEPDTKYFAAIDAGFKNDSFVFTLVGVNENRITQYLQKVWKGTRAQPVVSNDVAAWIRQATLNFPLDEICADQYAFAPLREIFQHYGLVLAEKTFSITYKKKIYFNLKNLYHRNQIDTLDIEQQTQEIKALIVEQSANGTVRISHPPGGHDDCPSALAVACLVATEGQSTGRFEFSAMSTIETYDIKTDIHGVAFDAPSPEMLAVSGHLPMVNDNSALFGRDPADGRLKRYEEFLEEDGDDVMAFL